MDFFNFRLIKRLKFLLIGFLLIGGFFSNCTKKEISKSNKVVKPNIIFILADDLALTDLSLYGETNWKTTNIDRLAKEGLYFKRAYTSASVCTPSRASLMSGKYPAVLGMAQNISNRAIIPRYHILSRQSFPLEEVSIGEALKKNDYATVYLGKWHLGPPDSYPHKQGFDKVIGCWPSKLNYYDPNKYFSPYEMTDLKDGPKGEYIGDRLTTEAIDQMKKYKKEKKPFFIYLSYSAVHTPLVVANKKAYKKFKKNKAIINPKYASMVVQLDNNVGRLMKAVKKLGIEKDTAIFFYSDNGGALGAYGGEGSNKYTKHNKRKEKIVDFHLPTHPQENYKEPYRGFKGWLYEGGIKAPLVVKYPRLIKPKSVSSKITSTPDIYSTLVDLAGGKFPHKQKLDGISLVPLFKNPNTKSFPEDRHLFWYYPHKGLKNPKGRWWTWMWHYSKKGLKQRGQKAVMQGNYKLVITHKEKPIEELFNLKTDIGEQTNLISKMPEKASHLKKALANWENKNGLSPTFEKPNF